ncbi:MAG: hypothetical protein AAGE18_11310 [Pseudomonadota bacterium]
MSGYFLKDPASELDYAIDWSGGYLEPEEAVAEDLGWRIEPDDARPGALQIVASSLDGARSVAVLRDGTAGHSYRVAARVRTTQDRIVERSILVRVAAR